jgi:hypothetical protein
MDPAAPAGHRKKGQAALPERAMETAEEAARSAVRAKGPYFPKRKVRPPVISPLAYQLDE